MGRICIRGPDGEVFPLADSAHDLPALFYCRSSITFRTWYSTMDLNDHLVLIQYRTYTDHYEYQFESSTVAHHQQYNR